MHITYTHFGGGDDVLKDDVEVQGSTRQREEGPAALNPAFAARL